MRIRSDLEVERQLQVLIGESRKQHSRISGLADEYRTKALDILCSIYKDSEKVRARALMLHVNESGVCVDHDCYLEVFDREVLCRTNHSSHKEEINR